MRLTFRRVLIRLALISGLLATFTSAAIAQTTVRVTRDQSTIWRQDFRTPAAVVNAGTVLAVVGRRDDWYEVLLPEGSGSSDVRTGFVFRAAVEVTGAAPAQQRPLQTVSEESSRAVGIWGFGQFGYMRFAAQRTFDAVLGQAAGGSFGGGAEVRIGDRWFLNASVERFRKTGERVFVLDQEVVRLGIPNTITLTPVTVTTGWRFGTGAATPYIGGGIGRTLYKESSKFSDPSEDVDDQFGSYHLLGGMEVRNNWVATAFELQYSRVPNSIGRGGASAAFQESDLGGFVGRVKVLVGR